MMTTPEVQPADIASLPRRVRWRRAGQALVRVMMHPEETDQVLVFASHINAGSIRRRLELFYADPRGQALADRQRALDSRTTDLAALGQLPEGTLGRAYATFMISHGLTPDVFDGTPKAIRDPRAAYLIQRVRQSHDLWHVVTRADTDPAGEIALQAFTFAQLGSPSSAILAIAGTLKALRHDRRIVKDVLALFRRGQAADDLLVFAWEDHWATPLVEVRRMLRLPENPALTGGYTRAPLAAAA